MNSTELVKQKILDYLDTVKIIKQSGLVGVIITSTETKELLIRFLNRQGFVIQKNLEDKNDSILVSSNALDHWTLPDEFKNSHVFILTDKEFASFELKSRIGPVCDLTN